MIIAYQMEPTLNQWFDKSELTFCFFGTKIFHMGIKVTITITGKFDTVICQCVL
jgi:hypothetical protein